MQLNPQTPRVKREPLLHIREKAAMRGPTHGICPNFLILLYTLPMANPSYKFHFSPAKPPVLWLQELGAVSSRAVRSNASPSRGPWWSSAVLLAGGLVLYMYNPETFIRIFCFFLCFSNGGLPPFLRGLIKLSFFRNRPLIGLYKMIISQQRELFASRFSFCDFFFLHKIMVPCWTCLDWTSVTTDMISHFVRCPKRTAYLSFYHVHWMDHYSHFIRYTLFFSVSFLRK